MGSIQGLRSEALAERAREDTNVQISGYLGSVNKGLGGQLSNLIDQLQGVISERTKAYTQIMQSKVKKTLEGKLGVGDAIVQNVFSIIRGTITAIGAAFGDAASALGVISAAASLAQSLLALGAAKFNYKSAALDYERAAAQLGVSDDPAISPKSGGAVQLLDLRDSIMPRYKPIDPINQIGFNASSTIGASNLKNRGYVGTLRRI